MSKDVDLESQLALVCRAAGALGRDDYLAVIVRSVSEALSLRWAFVSERVPDDPSQARTLAFCMDGQILDNVSYPLAGTPCADVYDRSVCVVTDGVQAAFPEDEMLVDLGAESYVGLPFFNDAGCASGHVGVMHDEALPATLVETPVFQIFTALAGSEFARRRAEAQKHRVERKLMGSERRESLGLLAGTIAHDLNNLLVGVTTNVGLARLEVGGGSAAHGYLDAIEETGARAADLARQMLAYSGRGRFEVGPADLSEIVGATIELLRPSLPKTAALLYEADEGLPPVHADGTQLRQLVMNLVLNAVDALEGKAGTVAVRLRAARIEPTSSRAQLIAREAVAGPGLALEVSDDGTGMDEPTLARIFDPFFTTKDKGNGLGLAAVQGIVQGRRGTLEVSSQLGAGSTFRVLLPVSAEQLRTPAPQATVESFEPGLRALVVDDESAVRNALSAVLARSEFVVDQAADGAQALTLLSAKADPFDIVLMDLSMPNLDGDEAIAWMAERMPTVPIVLMSGYDREELVDRFGRDAVAAFLQKPFTLAGVLDAVRGALA